MAVARSWRFTIFEFHGSCSTPKRSASAIPGSAPIWNLPSLRLQTWTPSLSSSGFQPCRRLRPFPDRRDELLRRGLLLQTLDTLAGTRYGVSMSAMTCSDLLDILGGLISALKAFRAKLPSVVDLTVV